MAKIDTQFMTKWLKDHTLWGRTYLYSPYKGVTPPPGGSKLLKRDHAGVMARLKMDPVGKKKCLSVTPKFALVNRFESLNLDLQ